jgi:hypothetical protein
MDGVVLVDDLLLLLAGEVAAPCLLALLLLVQLLVKGICPRGNNKVVIILFRVHNRCLFFMLELY